MRIGAFLISFLLASLALAQEPKGRNDASAIVASTLRDLGRCEAQLPALRELQAARVDGSLLDLDTVKRRLEAANPDLVLNLQTFKLSPKPKAEKPEK